MNDITDQLHIHSANSSPQEVDLSDLDLGRAATLTYQPRTTWTETVTGNAIGPGDWSANVVTGWRIRLLTADGWLLLGHDEPGDPDDTAVRDTITDLIGEWRDILSAQESRRQKARDAAERLRGQDGYWLMYGAVQAVNAGASLPLLAELLRIDPDMLEHEVDQRRHDDGLADSVLVTAAEAAGVLAGPGGVVPSVHTVRRTLSRKGVKAVSYEGRGGAALYPLTEVRKLAEAR